MVSERIIEDGFSFLLLLIILGFLWFHHWRRRTPGRNAVQRTQVRTNKRAA